MKKIALLLSTLILMSSVSVSAASYPAVFWNLNDKYNEAAASEDSDGIISHATQICSLLEGRTDEASVEILASRSFELARTYESIGSYSAAGDAYEMAIPYLEAAAEYGEETGELLKIAYDGSKRYKSEFEVYISEHAASGTERSNVLFGVNMTSSRHPTLKNDSLTYSVHRLGTDLTEAALQNVSVAADDGCASVVALELPAGIGVIEASEYEDELSELVKVLDSAGTNVYMVLGTDMNARLTAEDAEAYVSIFRHAADVIHEQSEHISAVWNPVCGAAAAESPHIFYPGDEYVDFVGVSLYIMGGAELNDPVKLLDDLMDTYGDRKPFIITKSGIVSAKTAVPMYEDEAAAELRSMYASLATVYPGIRGMVWTDSGLSAFDADGFAANEGALHVAYEKLVSGADIPGTYTELRAYIYRYGCDDITVTYYLDGNVIGSVSDAPYGLIADLSQYSFGGHTLSVEASSEGTVLDTRSFNITISEGVDVYVNGAPIDFNNSPVTQSGTTLVPIRTVASMLGATVEWQPLNRSVTVKRGALTVKMNIDERSAYVNGRVKELPYPVRIIGSVTYVPLRAFCEIMGADVIWDGINNRVDITE